MGRGDRQKCKVNKYGFPCSQPKKVKRVHGFETGDWVKVRSLSPEENAKRNEENQITQPVYGRVSIRSTGQFTVTLTKGISYNISSKYCRLLQQNDGYGYS
uniref:Putative HNH endonuclease n=2 Tax=Ignatiaceae TaxID=2682551 RepID=A0A1W6EGV2_9CHLO|nr:putative HNH endonuclease [Pseudocharacium americanum]YP_009367706.1 putative HNH endonuclease [Ignatius tetrasporus]ARK14634.1 putative HNH endonuclease [Pseudocharacium americanum]ARK14723.1 putative HNH endonuclease [Ignatius tetrasporus]